MNTIAYVVLVLALSFGGCKLDEQEYRRLDAWLLCDECRNGEREAVRALGGKAIHTLDQALRGPTPNRIANVEAQARQVYRTLPAPPAVSEAAYVTELRSNYIARYQQRAAISLGDIGGSRAIDALRRARDSATVRGYRSDVITVTESVLALTEADRFAGTITPPTPRFADTVRVGAGAGLPWDGDETVTLHGSPFADSLVIERWPDSLSFVAAATPGFYALSIGRLGPNSDTQVAALRIVRPPYRSHSPATAPLLTASPFPQIRYLALPSAPIDSGDYFRFAPAGNQRFTASVAGPGVTGLTLRWLVCATLADLPVVGPVTLVGRVIDEHGVPVVGATVRPAATAILAITGPGGRFSLSGLPAVSPINLIATMIGYQASANFVRLGVDSVTIVIRGTAVTSISRSSSSVSIPAGGCRYLQVINSGATQVLRLRLTSP